MISSNYMKILLIFLLCSISTISCQKSFETNSAKESGNQSSNSRETGTSCDNNCHNHNVNDSEDYNSNTNSGGKPEFDNIRLHAHYHHDDNGIPQEIGIGDIGRQGTRAVTDDLRGPKLNIINSDIKTISPSTDQITQAALDADSIIAPIEASIAYLFSSNVVKTNLQHESGNDQTENYKNLMNIFIELANNPNLNFDNRVMTAAFSAQRQLYYLTSVIWNYEEVNGADKYYLNFYSYLNDEFIDSLIKIVELDLSFNVFKKHGEYYNYLPFRAIRVLSYVYSGLVSKLDLPSSLNNDSDFYKKTKKKLESFFMKIKKEQKQSDYYFALVSGLRTVDLENKLETKEESYVVKFTGLEYKVLTEKLKEYMFKHKIVSEIKEVSEKQNGANPVNFHCSEKDLETYCERYSQLMPMIENEFLNFLGLDYFKYDYNQKLAYPDVFVFPTKKDFNLYTCMMFEEWCYTGYEHTAEIATSYVGFYDGVNNFALTYIDLTSKTSEFIDATMVHELAHYLQVAYLFPQDIESIYRNHFFQSAKWIMEGHAELFAVEFLFAKETNNLFQKMREKLGGFLRGPGVLSSLYDVVYGSLTNDKKGGFDRLAYLFSATAIKLMSDPNFRSSNPACFVSYDLFDAEKMNSLGLSGENIFLRLLVVIKNDPQFKEYYERNSQELGTNSKGHGFIRCIRDDTNLKQIFDTKVQTYEYQTPI